MNKVLNWIKIWRRYCAIFMELGYIPWHKKKVRKQKTDKQGVYIGTKEVIPFLNDDGKRTFSHLLLRPGYMMRDYILRGQHERYLAPFTALLVFYSVFTLILAVVQPDTGNRRRADRIIKKLTEMEVSTDSLSVADSLSVGSAHAMTVLQSIITTSKEALVMTRLDLYSEQADTSWKKSLAAVEGDLRTKGIPLFLNNFLLMWLSMAVLLRKRGVNFSGAAAASGYILCQFCLFMFLSLILTWGQSSELGWLLMGILVFIDYIQMLGVDRRTALWLTLKTGLWYVLFGTLFYLIIGLGLFVVAYYRI